MPRYRVDVTSRAHAQILEISCWWRENRSSNPTLFRDELAVVRQHLARVPASGPSYDSPEHADVRRMLLRQTQHHVYYVVDEPRRIVTVLAVWHTSRGEGPPL